MPDYGQRPHNGSAMGYAERPHNGSSMGTVVRDVYQASAPRLRGMVDRAVTTMAAQVKALALQYLAQEVAKKLPKDAAAEVELVRSAVKRAMRKVLEGTLAVVHPGAVRPPFVPPPLYPGMPTALPMPPGYGGGLTPMVQVAPGVSVQVPRSPLYPSYEWTHPAPGIIRKS